MEEIELEAENRETASEESSILIVEDDIIAMEKLKRFLAKQGFHVDTASIGEEGIEQFKNGNYSLIISDHRMPGMSGIEVLSAVHQINPDVPRILMTGNQDPNVIVSAINEGKVTHFLYKPWSDTSLLHIVQRGLKEATLLKNAKIMEQQLLKQHVVLSRSHTQLKHDMHMGRTIHEQFLMGAAPPKSECHTIKATSIPSKELDGDFYSFYTPSDKLFDLLIGDVMGKGIPAALLGVALKEKCNQYAQSGSLAKRLHINGLWEEDLFTPLEVINGLHEDFAQNLISIEYFVTLLYGRFNHQKRSFTFVNCGLNPPMHYHASTGEISYLINQNPPIGALEKYHYEPCEIYYEKGDLFFFYSDGVTESKNPHTGELYGFERLEQFIRNNIDEDISRLMTLLTDDLSNFTCKEHYQDDLTIVFYRIDDYYQSPENGNIGSFFPHIEQLPLVREFIDRLCHKTPWNSEEFSAQMQLIVDEIFCNLVEHGQLDSLTEIRIEGKVQEDGLYLEICDQGAGFDPEVVAEPSFSGSKQGGFGCYLVKKMATWAAYTQKERENGWNRYKIFKQYLKH